MGVKSADRREADQARRVKARSAGNNKDEHNIAMSLTIPAWVLREVTGKNTRSEVMEVMRQFEFNCELTDEGILYKPVKLIVKEGWGY